jgi:hypothetical protein
LILSPWKCADGDTLGTPLLSYSISSFDIMAALPVSVGVGLAALSFPEGAIVVHPVLFLTLEKG